MTALGKLGAWCGFLAQTKSASEVREIAAGLEDAGYEALWFGEALGREAFTHAALVLSATSRMTVATGIANIWVRDATAMRNAARTLAEAWPGRFVLGMGVSHRPLVDSRGHDYDRPMAAMETYLDAYDEARYMAPPPAEDPPVVLSALGPKMLRLSAERTDGAHPYFVPVEHTSIAREVMGEGPILAPEQTVVLSEDPAEARAAARRFMTTYLRLENYRNSLKRLGWSDEELDENPDRLVDSIVAWGSADRIAEHVVEHVARGADHVAVQCVDRDEGAFPLDDYVALAPALLEALGS